MLERRKEFKKAIYSPVGHHIENIELKNRKEENEKKSIQKQNSPETGDVANRKYVQNKIIEYVKEGLAKEDIIEKILKDPIMKQFEYLTNSGVKFEDCVTDWVENAINRNNRGNIGWFNR